MALSSALSKFNINQIGAVLGTTAYFDGELVARDVNITLPDLNPSTIDMKAMGTLSLPIWHLLDDMEFKITKIGTDLGLAAMMRDTRLEIEARWAQESLDQFANLREFGCKAFVTGIPKAFPGGEIAPGEVTEHEMTYTCLSYRLFIDEEEVTNVSRLSNNLKIAGVDYAKNISQFL